MKHKDKVKLANKMLTREEKAYRISKFSSKAWLQRADAIQARIKRKNNERKRV